jgi:formate hydrogenlyase subunit 6/NADH:ubiquinone oxidoreductase subunit I
MADLHLDVGASVALPKSGLDGMVANLRQMGYQTIGPRIQDNTVVYGAIEGLADLPRGYISEQEAGRYQLNYTGHGQYFDITPGPQSWKQYFFPPVLQTLEYTRDPENPRKWQSHLVENPPPLNALIGVRPCELAAIAVQDRVFLREEWNDPVYRARRQSVAIVAVNCLHPCGTCFCASMGTGPKAESGFDLCLTELEDVFLVEVGSEAGRLAMTGLKWQPASAYYLQTAHQRIEEARRQMGREIPEPESLPEFLLNNLEAETWDKVAARCLSCTNCTQVCPTCFCWDVRDNLALSGQSAKRERVWDSCFNPDYSYVFGGNTRPNTRSRYRQWLTHKLASWYHQFGVSGCVGCGRCITWCPAGIDITAEVAALRAESAQ